MSHKALFLASTYTTFKNAINQVTDSVFIKYINTPKLGVVVKVKMSELFQQARMNFWPQPTL